MDLVKKVPLLPAGSRILINSSRLMSPFSKFPYFEEVPAISTKAKTSFSKFPFSEVV